MSITMSSFGVWAMAAVLTLSQFYETVFVKLRLAGKNPKTVSSYESSIRLWKLLTSDPPLDQVTDMTCADFLIALGSRKGKIYETMAPASLLKHTIQLQSVLDLAGPRSKDNKRGQGIITSVPYFEAPKLPKKEVDALYTVEEMHALYAAAEVATAPEIPDVSPVAIWRAFLVFAYYTGMRADSLFGATYSNIDKPLVRIPNEFAKNGRGFTQYVHAEAFEYLKHVWRPNRDTIFPWPYRGSKKRFCYDWLRKIQTAAGFPKSKQHGYHAFRRTQQTQLASLTLGHKQAIQVAQTAAGHADSAITLQHYISGDVQRRMMIEAIDSLPSPVPPNYSKPGKARFKIRPACALA